MATINFTGVNMFRPFRASIFFTYIPRALPWAIIFRLFEALKTPKGYNISAWGNAPGSIENRLISPVRAKYSSFGATILLAAWLWLSGSAVAQISLTLELDSASFGLEDEIAVQVSLQGASSAGGEEPVLSFPKDAFSLESSGVATSMQIKNGRTTRSVIYNYRLLPKKSGQFVIGPARLNFQGRNFESPRQAVTILTATASKETGASQDLFLRQVVSNSSPYLGEQIQYTVQFFRAIRVLNSTFEVFPNFSEFLTFELGKESEHTETFKGVRYQVYEIKRALYPLKVGEFKIPPVVLRCEATKPGSRRRSSPFDSFFGGMIAETTPKRIESSTLSIKVSPLPKPPSGETGLVLVGKFTLDTILPKENHYRVGDSINFSYDISGSGNLSQFRLPPFADSSDFKAYYDKPVSKTSANEESLIQSSRFSIAVVPQKPGVLAIPAVSLLIFDPKANQYKHLQTQPFKLSIEEGTPSESAPISFPENLPTEDESLAKKEIKLLGRDILPIDQSIHRLDRRQLDKHLWPGLIFIHMFFAIGYGLLVRRQKNLLQAPENWARARKKKALKHSLHLLKTLNHRLRKSKSEPIARLTIQLFEIVRTYIADTLNIESETMTAEEAVLKLKAAGALLPTIEDLSKIMMQLEHSQFSQITPKDEPLLENIRKLLKLLPIIDAQIKKTNALVTQDLL